MLLRAGESDVDRDGARAALPGNLRKHLLRVLAADRLPTARDQEPHGRVRRRLADALLQPTRVYVKAAEALWAAGITPRGMAHISGGGLLNLARLAADVSYELDAMVPVPEIFTLIAQQGEIPPATMYATFNMGVGLIASIPAAKFTKAKALLDKAEEKFYVVGRVVKGERRVQYT